MKKVGIYAGTFDPVHEGHLAFAKAAAVHSNLEKVFLLVEPRPRRKQGVRALEHRQNMVSLSIRHEPRLGSIVLDQSRFTVIETLPVLRERFQDTEIHLLMGDDVLFHLAEWPHVEELVRAVSFVIGVREGSNSKVEHWINSQARARGLKFKYSLFTAPYETYSSTTIRRLIKKGLHPEGLPLSVRGYIEEEGLYSSAANS